MEVVSVNVSPPREVALSGARVVTGICKRAVSGAVMLREQGFEGDGQANTKDHGGPYKAAYAYPSEHYAHWRDDCGVEGEPGFFGENLTIRGLLETDVCIGDLLQIGAARVRVSQPRQPCLTMQKRAGRSDFLKRFLESLKVGFYLRVLEPGPVRAGDAIAFVERDPEKLSVHDLMRVNFFDRDEVETMQRALRANDLFPEWRASIAARLEKLGAKAGAKPGVQAPLQRARKGATR